MSAKKIIEISIKVDIVRKFVIYYLQINPTHSASDSAINTNIFDVNEIHRTYLSGLCWSTGCMVFQKRK